MAGILPPDPIYILRHNNMDSVNSLCFHNSNRLFAGTLKGTVNLWDMDSNRLILQLNNELNQPILSMLHDKDNLITQTKGNFIKIWRLTNSGYENVTESDKNIKNINENYLGFCKMEFCSNLNSILLPKNKNDISLYDMNSFEEQTTFNYDNNNVNLGTIMAMKYINFKNGQNYILALYESGDFLTWDLRCNKVINISNFNENSEQDNCLLTMDYNIESNRGIFGGVTDKLGVISYNKTTMELTKRSQIGLKNPGVNCIKIRDDCKIFSTGGWDGHIRIFSWKSLRPLAVLTDHKDGVMDIAYSNEKVSMWKSPIMAAGGKDGQITLWDIYN